MTSIGVDGVRDRLGRMVFERVAGPDGAQHRSRIHDTPGPRWFGPDRPIRKVHGDAAMFVGGIRALLLQSLHPQAMAAVHAHSGFRGDPWGRLARTSRFLAVTTYGTSDDAWAAVQRVRAVHDRVRGATPAGEPYHAADPHLLAWIHVAEVDSFLRAYDIYGGEPLDDVQRDGYVADTARIGAALGVVDPPGTAVELRARLDAYRPELVGTAQAREAVRFIVWNPPVPWVQRPVYGALTAAAIELMPRWSRGQLRLPHLPVAESPVVRALGTAATRTLRWALRPADATGRDSGPARV